MERREKLKIGVVFGVLSALVVALLVRGVILEGRERDRRAALTARAEGMLYESLLLLCDTLGGIETEENSLRLYRAVALGEMCMEDLGLPHDATVSLRTYYARVSASVTAREEGGALLPFASTLLSHLKNARSTGESFRNHFPVMAVQEESTPDPPAPFRVPVKDATSLARAALGGNTRPSSPARIDENGFLFLLGNAYVQVSPSGRVVALLRQLPKEMSDQVVMTKEEAHTAAKRFLSSVGYSEHRTEIASSMFDGGMWYITARDAEYEITLTLSGGGVCYRLLAEVPA